MDLQYLGLYSRCARRRETATNAAIDVARLRGAYKDSQAFLDEYRSALLAGTAGQAARSAAQFSNSQLKSHSMSWAD